MLLRRAILPPQISLTQAWTLLLLHDSGPQRVTSLAEGCSVSQPTMSGCIIGMERLGWVRRDTGGTDRRVVTVCLTEDGKKVMHDLEAARTRCCWPTSNLCPRGTGPRWPRPCPRCAGSSRTKSRKRR